MMSSLFSIFDPTSSVNGFPLNWLSVCFFLIPLTGSYWGSSNRGYHLIFKLLTGYVSEMSIHLKSKSKSALLFLLSVFVVVLYMNLMSLTPWVFPATGHVSVTISLAFPCWLTFTIYSLLNGFVNLMSHMVPSGTPSGLTPFMVVIETISMLIRPLTLSIRLGANMIAGHLLVSLISGSVTLLTPGFAISPAFGLSLLLVLELAVACIQAYVFSTLLVLYLSEI